MEKQRLDQAMVSRELVASRSQAESYIKLGEVSVNKKPVTKPGFLVKDTDKIALAAKEQYVSRAGLKLASVSNSLGLIFEHKVVLDVGSSTGGFTDFALKHGAKKVIAIDVGTNQLHPSLRTDSRIELHEQTDIRDVRELSASPDLVVVDVSFISLREILPGITKLISRNTEVITMVKPQFEAGGNAKHKGVIKNDSIRRQILKDFESWVQKLFKIIDKADSEVAGSKGNRERFYILKRLNQ
jgi:23S rRNA (cytidine1920-2'-O)/16S rRNA (cytidine1409-2'-O)-methyltransferase